MRLRQLIRVADAQVETEGADTDEDGDREHSKAERTGVLHDQLAPAAERAQAAPPTRTGGHASMPVLTYGRSAVRVNSERGTRRPRSTRWEGDHHATNRGRRSVQPPTVGI
jgi:hypothetical protein